MKTLSPRRFDARSVSRSSAHQGSAVSWPSKYFRRVSGWPKDATSSTPPGASTRKHSET